MPAAKPAWPTLNRSHPLAQGLVFGAPFYEGSGLTVNDLSGKGNNGTLSGTTIPVWLGGQNGYALSFDGSSGYVIGNAPVTGLPVTLAAWAYPTASAFNTVLSLSIAGTGNSWVRINSVNSFTANAGDHTAAQLTTANGVSFSLKTWYHLAATFTTSTIALYINGALFSSINNTLSTFSAFTKLTVGVLDFSSIIQFFPGIIDAPAVWNRALPANEVESLYADSFQMYRRRRAVLAAVTPVLYSFPPRNQQVYTLTDLFQEYQAYRQSPYPIITSLAGYQPIPNRTLFYNLPDLSYLWWNRTSINQLPASQLYKSIIPNQSVVLDVSISPTYYTQSHYISIPNALPPPQSILTKLQNYTLPTYDYAWWDVRSPNQIYLPSPLYINPQVGRHWDSNTETWISYTQSYYIVQTPLAAPNQPHPLYTQTYSISDLLYPWYDRHVPTIYPPPIANLPPTHQGSQRYDSLYDFDYRWWEQPTRWPVPLNRLFNPPVEFVSWQGTTNVEIAWQGVTNLAITWQGQSNLAITW